MTDQMRADAMGCSGGWVATPALDGLAAEGIRYENAYTNCPLCAPARLSLMLGQYPHNTGVWNNDPHTLSADANNWVKELRGLGYRTSVFGKTHLYPHNGSIPDMREAEYLIRGYGFDAVDEIPGPRVSVSLKSHMTARWEELGLWEKMKEDYKSRFSGHPAVARASVLPEEEYPDVYVGQRARRYLENDRGSSPWFSFVSFGGPHEPWDAPDRFSAAYDAEDMPEALKPFRDLHPRRPQGEWDKKPPYDPPSPADIAEIRRNYAGNVSLIDEQIGALLEVLKERGEYDNTMILFTSDHGEMNGDHGRLYKSNFLESAVKIPLIIRHPEFGRRDQGRTEKGLVELMDVGPTLVEAAGGRIPYPQQARCIAPISGSQFIREDVLSEINGESMLCDGRWKIVINRENKPYMLFDLESDPEEQSNLAGLPASADIERNLQKRLEKRKESV